MMNSSFSKDYVGNQIKKIRIRNNLDIKTFATQLNVSAKTVMAWEKGKNTPGLKTIVNMCNLYHLSLDEFFPIR